MRPGFQDRERAEKGAEKIFNEAEKLQDSQFIYDVASYLIEDRSIHEAIKEARNERKAQKKKARRGTRKRGKKKKVAEA